MHAISLDDLPGFRRRFRISPASNRVVCALEDDYHCMAVTVRHDGHKALEVDAVMHRAPWTTCPGAERKLNEMFVGVGLGDFFRRGGKKQNCTHLYDLVLLAASHAFDEAETVYDILVSDPDGSQRCAEVRCNGKRVLGWCESNFEITAPAELAGKSLLDLRPWIASLAPDFQEAARLLQWGNMIANGRTIPMEKQSDATSMPPNCFTFQPERAVLAERNGIVRDFSKSGHEPLADVVSD